MSAFQTFAQKADLWQLSLHFTVKNNYSEKPFPYASDVFFIQTVQNKTPFWNLL